MVVLRMLDGLVLRGLVWCFALLSRAATWLGCGVSASFPSLGFWFPFGLLFALSLELASLACFRAPSIWGRFTTKFIIQGHPEGGVRRRDQFLQGQLPEAQIILHHTFQTCQGPMTDPDLQGPWMDPGLQRCHNDLENLPMIVMSLSD